MKIRLFHSVFLFCGLFFSAGQFLPDPVLAHGTGYRVIQADRAVAVEFYYSDGAAMAYTESLVFSPENAEIEHQNGRTDKSGKVVFLPDMPGEWQVSVNDGTGHKVQARISVSSDMMMNQSETQTLHREAFPKIITAVLGVSLIFNLFSVLAFLKRRR